MDGFLVVLVADLVVAVIPKQYLQDPLDQDSADHLAQVDLEEVEVDSVADSTEVEVVEVSGEVETSKTEADMVVEEEMEAEGVSDTKAQDSPEEAATTPTSQLTPLLDLKVAEAGSPEGDMAVLLIEMVSRIETVARGVGTHVEEETAILVVEMVAHPMVEVDQDPAEATMSR